MAAFTGQFGKMIKRLGRRIQWRWVRRHGFPVEQDCVIETRYHDSVNVLQDLSCKDDAARAASPFDRAHWFELLAATGLKPLIVTATNGGLSAALALTIGRDRLETLRNWYSFTWRPLAPEGPRGDRLLIEIAQNLGAHGHRVILEPVPDEDGSASRLAKAFRAAGWRVDVTCSDKNHYLDVGGSSFAQYWDTRPGPLRTTLKRKGGKVTVDIRTDFDAGAWANYERIYAESWKPSEGHPSMLRAFAEQEGLAGRLRLGLAMHDGEPIAAQFWTVENGVAYIHKLAHLETHRHLSAGTTLTAAMFEHAIDRDRVDFIDFGTGDEPYKADWMNASRARYRIDCIDLKQPRGWIAAGTKTLLSLARRIRPVLARRPGAG